MRAIRVLLILDILIVALSGEVGAVIRCDQVHVGMCVNGPPACTPVLLWRGSCAGEDREWKCAWTVGEYCLDPVWGPWQPCTCEAEAPTCDCLLAGTPITLADGSTKPVEAIRKGDRVLAYDESTAAPIGSDVTAVHAPYTASHYFIINEKIRVTETHPVLSRGRWVPVTQLRVGDVLTAADGSPRPIFSLRRAEEPATVYNFQVAAGTYVAHGIVVHNKENCSEYEQYPCEGCGP